MRKKFNLFVLLGMIFNFCFARMIYADVVWVYDHDIYKPSFYVAIIIGIVIVLAISIFALFKIYKGIEAEENKKEEDNK